MWGSPGGPRTRRVYDALRQQILAGSLPPGTQLPAHTKLASQFGVSPVTVRQVLARLDAEGLVSRESGRGTFVRAHDHPLALIVGGDLQTRTLLQEYLTRAAYRPVEVAGPPGALRALEQDRAIALVISDSRLPTKDDGINFIRTLRRGWPGLPVVVVTSKIEDLADLHGTPEWPIRVFPKPVRVSQIEEGLRLTSQPSVAAARRVRQFAQLVPGDHVCLINRGSIEDVIIPYLKDGLARGEACVYVTPDGMAHHVTAGLAAAGVDLEQATQRGAWTVLNTQETYPQPSDFTAETMFLTWQKLLDGALAAGLSGLRLAARMPPALGQEQDCASLIEYEAQLNTFLADRRMLVLCYYHRSTFLPACIQGVLRTHPLVGLDEHLYPNPYYEPPEVFFAAVNHSDSLLDWRLSHLTSPFES